MKGKHYTTDDIDMKAIFSDDSGINPAIILISSMRYFYEDYEHNQKLYEEGKGDIHKQMAIDKYNCFVHLLLKTQEL